ncbi:amidase [Thermocoleostomius sinensis]|uniref:Amidase n=1 Tax=Thermocoleostomius sinensis A174 TaxID=2016057 RepID=A0A9E8ZFL2_9CYAN|nr:amidase [Thermocoleostomius sinensis]WAL62485.1 amidase [Thermocoleostomius sinensis A174]
MNPTDLAFTSALEQAELIRRKEISPLELTQLYLSRIEQLNPQLGCYFTVAVDPALADARAKTEQLAGTAAELPPFWGVPLSIKDLNSVAGLPSTLGSPVLRNNIAAYDDAVVTRIKQAGFVILGKTAVPELATLPYTEPQGFPPARNPWHLDYTPGGSSGGAAAAVAAGLSSVAHASDGGGSIRGPAFCCGVVGLKPARGRVSYAPIGDALGGASVNGSLGRTVADAAALLDVMSGYVTGDPYWLPDPEIPFATVALHAQQQSLRSHRIAFATGMPPVGEANSICQQAVLATAQQLENLGHHLEPEGPDCTGLVEPFTLIWRTSVKALGLPPEALQPFNRWLYDQADSSGDYQKALWAMQVLSRRLVAFLDRYDAVLLPVYLHPAIRVGEWADLSPAATLEKVIQWIAPCPLANATGLPAVAIPTGFTPDGLPMGVQLVGRPADEATIIALAAQLEAVQPWSQHRPSMAIGG